MIIVKFQNVKVRVRDFKSKVSNKGINVRVMNRPFAVKPSRDSFSIKLWATI